LAIRSIAVPSLARRQYQDFQLVLLSDEKPNLGLKQIGKYVIFHREEQDAVWVRLGHNGSVEQELSQRLFEVVQIGRTNKSS
jgi:hypothetical protein